MRPPRYLECSLREALRRQPRTMYWSELCLRSRTDYIMGMDRRIFWNVYVRDPRHNSDHYMFMGCLCSAPLREHSR